MSEGRKRFKVTFEVKTPFGESWHAMEREATEESVTEQYLGLLKLAASGDAVRNPRLFCCDEPAWQEIECLKPSA